MRLKKFVPCRKKLNLAGPGSLNGRLPGTGRAARALQAFETESRKSPKQVKATITASIQYWERAAIR